MNPFLTCDGMKPVSSYSAVRLTKCKQTLLLVAVIKISLWRGIMIFCSCKWTRFYSGLSFLGRIVTHVLPKICFGTPGRIPLEIWTYYLSKGNHLRFLPSYTKRLWGWWWVMLLVLAYACKTLTAHTCYSVITTAQHWNSCECGVPQITK